MDEIRTVDRQGVMRLPIVPRLISNNLRAADNDGQGPVWPEKNRQMSLKVA